MTWSVEFSDTAKKQLKKLGKAEQKRILQYLRKRVLTKENPKQLGKTLKGKFSELWRYRVGNYRLVCEIRESVLIILVVRIGHRKDIYKQSPFS